MMFHLYYLYIFEFSAGLERRRDAEFRAIAHVAGVMRPLYIYIYIYICIHIILYIYVYIYIYTCL